MQCPAARSGVLSRWRSRRKRKLADGPRSLCGVPGADYPKRVKLRKGARPRQLKSRPKHMARGGAHQRAVSRAPPPSGHGTPLRSSVFPLGFAQAATPACNQARAAALTALQGHRAVPPGPPGARKEERTSFAPVTGGLPVRLPQSVRDKRAVSTQVRRVAAANPQGRRSYVHRIGRPAADHHHHHSDRVTADPPLSG